MALSGNQLYPKGKEHLLKKQIDVTDISGTDQLKCALMSTSYTAGDGDECLQQYRRFFRG